MLAVKRITKAKEIRNRILDFESALSNVPGAMFGDNKDCPLKHTFADGIYVREIFIPKGMMIVGKIHRHSHPNFLMKGEVDVITEEGEREHLIAPLSIISPAGTKRIVYAREDTVWITVHITNETDLEKIEEEVIAKTYYELECTSKNKLFDPSNIELNSTKEVQI